MADMQFFAIMVSLCVIAAQVSDFWPVKIVYLLMALACLALSVVEVTG